MTRIAWQRRAAFCVTAQRIRAGGRARGRRSHTWLCLHTAGTHLLIRGIDCDLPGRLSKQHVGEGHYEESAVWATLG